MRWSRIENILTHFLIQRFIFHIVFLTMSPRLDKYIELVIIALQKYAIQQKIPSWHCSIHADSSVERKSFACKWKEKFRLQSGESDSCEKHFPVVVADVAGGNGGDLHGNSDGNPDVPAREKNAGPVPSAPSRVKGYERDELARGRD